MKLERDIETEVRLAVEAQGGRLLKLQLFNERGFPDRTLMMPGGELQFLEFKKPGGRLSHHQERWIRRLRDMGFKAHVIRKIEDLKL